jgi:hypothetical protein
MLRRLFERLVNWYRMKRTFGNSRRFTGYRASSTAERLICSGSLQRGCHTGSPLARDCK